MSNLKKRLRVGLVVMVVGAVMSSIDDFTTLWLGIICLSMGMMYLLWDHIPDNEEFEDYDHLIAWMFQDIESETEAMLRVFGVALLVLTGMGYLLSLVLIDTWGVWATGIPGVYLFGMSFRKWLEEMFLPIPLR